MKVAALVEAVDHCCWRFRLEQFQPWLIESGIDLTPHAIPRGFWARHALFSRLRQSDAVFVQRKLFSVMARRSLRRYVNKIIYEIDDAVMYRDSFSARGPHSRTRRARFAGMCAIADRAIVGNEFLKGETLRYLPADRVDVVPTCVDTGFYKPKTDHGPKEVVTLGWIGSSSTLRGLMEVHGLLEDIGRRHKNIRLKIIADAAFECLELPVVHKPWAREDEPADLASCDIGISHVPDDVWSRGKCGLKVLQYMACGLPVIANPVGVHNEMIHDGKEGFLCVTHTQWREAVEALVADPDARERMGARAREEVDRRYSTQVWGPRVVEAVKKVVDPP